MKMTPVWVLRQNSMGFRKGIWAILVGVEKGIHSIITGKIMGASRRLGKKGSGGEELGFGHKGLREPLMEAISRLQGCQFYTPAPKSLCERGVGHLYCQKSPTSPPTFTKRTWNNGAKVKTAGKETLNPKP